MRFDPVTTRHDVTPLLALSAMVAAAEWPPGPARLYP